MMSGTNKSTAAKPTIGRPDLKCQPAMPLPSRPPATDVRARPWESPADPETLARIKRALERL
jgi:hypothetical protein